MIASLQPTPWIAQMDGLNKETSVVRNLKVVEVVNEVEANFPAIIDIHGWSVSSGMHSFYLTWPSAWLERNPSNTCILAGSVMGLYWSGSVAVDEPGYTPTSAQQTKMLAMTCM